MDAEVKKLPGDVRLGPLAEQVFSRLEKLTAFPWPVLESQCKRCDLDPALLDERGLRAVLPFLVTSVARFTSPAKGEALRTELESLLGPRRIFQSKGG